MAANPSNSDRRTPGKRHPPSDLIGLEVTAAAGLGLLLVLAAFFFIGVVVGIVVLVALVIVAAAVSVRSRVGVCVDEAAVPMHDAPEQLVIGLGQVRRQATQSRTA